MYAHFKGRVKRWLHWPFRMEVDRTCPKTLRGAGDTIIGVTNFNTVSVFALFCRTLIIQAPLDLCSLRTSGDRPSS